MQIKLNLNVLNTSTLHMKTYWMNIILNPLTDIVLIFCNTGGLETKIFWAIIRIIIERTRVHSVQRTCTHKITSSTTVNNNALNRHPKSIELDFTSCTFNYKSDYESRSSVGEPGSMIRVLKCSRRTCELFEILKHHDMWHDQEEWVGCRGCCFWDIGKNSVRIPLFHFVFSIVKSFITL